MAECAVDDASGSQGELRSSVPAHRAVVPRGWVWAVLWPLFVLGTIPVPLFPVPEVH